MLQILLQIAARVVAVAFAVVLLLVVDGDLLRL